MNEQESNILDLSFSILLLIGLSIAYQLVRPEIFTYPVRGDMGLFLPSANLWNLGRWSGILCVVMLFMAGGLILHINRHFNLTRTLSYSPTILFWSLSAAFPWVACSFNASLIALLANIIALWLFLGGSKISTNAAITFLVGTMLAWGSMIQYGFVLLMVIWLSAGLMMRIMDWRSILAYLLGIAATYWCAFGTGIIRIESFHMPNFGNFLNFENVDTTLRMLLFVGSIAVLQLFLGMSNLLRLFSTNRDIRDMHHGILILGLGMTVLMIVDFHNFLFYIPTLLMCVGLEFGYIFNPTRRQTEVNGWLGFLMIASAAFGISLLF